MTPRFRTLAGLAGLLLFAAFVGLAPTRAPSDRAPLPAGASSLATTPTLGATAAAPPAAFADPGAYEPAARALRRRDCAGAQTLLDAIARDTRDAAGATDSAGAAGTDDALRIVSGLYAHACENVELAMRRLGRPATGPGSGFLEDWRLLVLGEAAYAAGYTEQGATAFDTLLDDHPASPLWERTLVTAVEHARDEGRFPRALALIDRGRSRDGLSAETAARIEAAAWEIGTAAGDWVTRSRAARRLLARAPERAEELGVVELFRPGDGGQAEGSTGSAGSPGSVGSKTRPIEWATILSVPELRHRAAALLDADRPDDALEALGAVPLGEHDLDWTLLAARALTRDRRAAEALSLLDHVAAGQAAGADPAAAGSSGGTRLGPDQVARVAWERARAAADLASPLRSGARLARTERARMAEAARRHLEEVVRSGGDPELVRAALRRLFADHAEDGRFDDAVAALGLLRRLDPGDTTGASYLWGKGWNQYRRRNYSGAIGYWSELASLYPDSRETRAGRYWSARAFDELGNRQRSRELLEEVAAAPSTDFYRRHALTHLARLTGPGAPSPQDDPSGQPVPPGEIWPDDPALERARLLTDLGLDSLALAEIEGLERLDHPGPGDGQAGGDGALDRRAVNVLTALCLSRQGKRRAAIPLLRRTFPVLGGPFQTQAPLPAQNLYYPVDFTEAVDSAATAAGLPRSLLYGIIREESAFDITALSHAGARGLMQLMPATGREVAHRLGMPFSADRLDDPAVNVRLGAAYFARVLAMFDGRTELALAGYNGGPYRVKRLWRHAGPRAEVDFFTEALPIEESRGYVKRVILFANSYQEMYGL